MAQSLKIGVCRAGPDSGFGITEQDLQDERSVLALLFQAEDFIRNEIIDLYGRQLKKISISVGWKR